MACQLLFYGFNKFAVSNVLSSKIIEKSLIAGYIKINKYLKSFTFNFLLYYFGLTLV